jgi:hypothetical protein
VQPEKKKKKPGLWYSFGIAHIFFKSFTETLVVFKEFKPGFPLSP